MKINNSKKLNELCCWEHIDTVNEKLDSGDRPATVYEWIIANGFSISHPLVYEYAKRRKLAATERILAEKYISPINIQRLQNVNRVPITDSKPKDETVKRLKNDLDALEVIIQLGYSTLLKLPSGAITPKLLMEAIDLKNKITEGAYGNLTEYGLSHLKNLEEQKIKRIIEIFKKFIPEDKSDEVVAALESFEDEFYKGTEYYIDYLKAKD